MTLRGMRQVLRGALVGGLAVAAAAAQSSNEEANSASRLVASGTLYRGLAVQVHRTGPDAVSEHSRLIHEIADLGANAVLLSANGFQEDIDSVTISAAADEGLSDRQWLQLFEVARDRHLSIILMPKVLLSNPRAGAWRGKISPASWKTWFEQYRAFVMRFARLAQRGHADVLIVGSELVSTEKHTEQWRRIIAEVRGVYAGKLAYSANWDHYRSIQFWNDLDLIGLTTYYNVNPSRQHRPTVPTLTEAWTQIRDDILQWQSEIKLPLLFTEVGWCSQEECSIYPWNYYHKPEATPAGHTEQRNNYQAFLNTWAHRSEVAGIIFWEWTSASGGDSDYHYTPKQKPAEAVLRQFFTHGDAESPAPR